MKESIISKLKEARQVNDLYVMARKALFGLRQAQEIGLDNGSATQSLEHEFTQAVLYSADDEEKIGRLRELLDVLIEEFERRPDPALAIHR